MATATPSSPTPPTRAPYRNSENLDLEPVWPYSLVGDTSPQYDLAKLTYTTRKFRNSNT